MNSSTKIGEIYTSASEAFTTLGEIMEKLSLQRGVNKCSDEVGKYIIQEIILFCFHPDI